MEATLCQTKFTPSHPIRLRSYLILFSHLRLSLRSGPFPPSFLNLSSITHLSKRTTYLSIQFFLNDHPNNKRFGEKCKLRTKFPITTFFSYPYHLPPFYPDTFVSIFFSNTLNVPLFLRVTDEA